MARACQLLLATLVGAALLSSVSADAGGTFRWCTLRAAELDMCRNMTAVLTSIDPNNYTWSCYPGNGAEPCMKAIRDNLADIVNLDGSDVYTAATTYALKPVLKEQFVDSDTQYWAVAVVPKKVCDDNSNVKLSDFKGKTACSTGYGRSAGWTIPVGFMSAGQNPIMQPVSQQSTVPNDIETVSAFFSKVCAANDNAAERICSACGGDCSRNDPFFDYKGAFNCLQNANGGQGADIAFLKHDIVPQYALGGSKAESWAKAPAEDFRLLCPQGGCASITSYTTCSFARVPAHAIMVRGSYPAYEVEELYETFERANQDPRFKAMFFSGKNTNGYILTAAAQSVATVNVSAAAYLGQIFSSKDAVVKLNAVPQGTTSSAAGMVRNLGAIVVAVVAAALAL